MKSGKSPIAPRSGQESRIGGKTAFLPANDGGALIENLCFQSKNASERRQASPPPKKSLGQHFLHEESLCRKMAELLQLNGSDQVLEIGPGPGALTNCLESAPHRILVLLEKDRHWAFERGRRGASSTVSVLMDALRFDWKRLCALGQWKITGNLPYNVASPLIWDIVSECACLTRAVFMVQKEVGQRLAASPGNKNYGALSVWAQSHASVKIEFIIRPGAFCPPPKVDSAVISITPLPEAEKPERPFALRQILRLCFQNRRKQLGGIFRRAKAQCLYNALDALGIPPDLRPENLDCQTFCKLALLCGESLGGQSESGIPE